MLDLHRHGHSTYAMGKETLLPNGSAANAKTGATRSMSEGTYGRAEIKPGSIYTYVQQDYNG